MVLMVTLTRPASRAWQVYHAIGEPICGDTSVTRSLARRWGTLVAELWYTGILSCEME